LGVAADRTGGVFPLGKAGAVENVLAEDGEEAGGFVHALEADWAGWEFEK
jgi:hypothetical protein